MQLEKKGLLESKESEQEQIYYTKILDSIKAMSLKEKDEFIDKVDKKLETIDLSNETLSQDDAQEIYQAIMICEERFSKTANFLITKLYPILGKYNLNTQEYELSEIFYKSIYLWQKDLEIKYNYVFSLVSQGKISQAASHLDHLIFEIDKCSNNELIAKIYKLCYEIKKHESYDQALKFLKKAIKINPYELSFIEELYKFVSKHENSKTAIKELEKVSNSKNKNICLLYITQSHCDNQNYKEAEKNIKKLKKVETKFNPYNLKQFNYLRLMVSNNTLSKITELKLFETDSRTEDNKIELDNNTKLAIAIEINKMSLKEKDEFLDEVAKKLKNITASNIKLNQDQKIEIFKARLIAESNYIKGLSFLTEKLYYVMGQHFLYTQQFIEAEKIYQNFYYLEQSLKVKNNYVLSLLFQKKIKEANDHLDHLLFEINRCDNNEEKATSYSLCYKIKKNQSYEQALEFLKKAIQTDPNQKSFIKELYEFVLTKKGAKSAISQLKEISNEINEADCLVYITDIQLDKKQYREAHINIKKIDEKKEDLSIYATEKLESLESKMKPKQRSSLCCLPKLSNKNNNDYKKQTEEFRSHRIERRIVTTV